MATDQEPAVNGVTVKGWRNGLLLLLPATGDWAEVIDQMDARLDEAKARSFWRGAQTTVDCGARMVGAEDLTTLVDRMKRAWGLVPIAVVATDGLTRAAAEKLALTVYDEMPIIKKPSREVVTEPEPAPRPSSIASTPPPGASNALYVPSTVRSGQRILHEGHLVICGDVNAGAEVVASGDVLIFGTLRGLAHAGCLGDESARIVASSLRPPQLRIAAKIARAPEESAPGSKNAPGSVGKPGPEVARIVNGEIQVYPL